MNKKLKEKESIKRIEKRVAKGKKLLKDKSLQEVIDIMREDWNKNVVKGGN